MSEDYSNDIRDWDDYVSFSDDMRKVKDDIIIEAIFGDKNG